MTWNATKDRTLALAALLQAGQLVVELAQKDHYDETALLASTNSVLTLEGTEAEKIFGGTEQLQLGLNTLHTLLRATPTPAHKELIRYSVSMAQLAQRLMQSSSSQALITKGVYEVQNQRSDDEMHLEAEILYTAIGHLYQTTLSQLEPKIIVRGAQGRLESLNTVSRIRSALFAGVRAAYLWHQLGGRRWHLVVARRSYVAQATEYLSVS